MGVTHAQLALMHVTKFMWFDWSAVLESFWYKFTAQVS